MQKIAKPELFYLFEADFNDGTTYIQGTDDESIDTPGKNAFYDILQREDEVIRFHMVGQGHRYTVDLRDGHFEVDGVPFEIHDQMLAPLNLRLVYWKEMRAEQDIKATVNKDMGIDEEVMAERNYINRFFIGWKCYDRKKKPVQYTIAIS